MSNVHQLPTLSAQRDALRALVELAVRKHVEHLSDDQLHSMVLRPLVEHVMQSQVAKSVA